jgi:hypothetical protein
MNPCQDVDAVWGLCSINISKMGSVSSQAANKNQPFLHGRQLHEVVGTGHGCQPANQG